MHPFLQFAKTDTAKKELSFPLSRWIARCINDETYLAEGINSCRFIILCHFQEDDNPVDLETFFIARHTFSSSACSSYVVFVYLTCELCTWKEQEKIALRSLLSRHSLGEKVDSFRDGSQMYIWYYSVVSLYDVNVYWKNSFDWINKTYLIEGIF